MTDPAETPAQAKRRRLVSFGEIIALAALIISGLGLWNGWSSRNDKSAVIAATSRPVPLALRGKLEDDGKRLAIAPVEPGHALETLTLTAPGKPALDLGSEPRLSASAVEGLINAARKKEGSGSLRVTFAAHYIDGGTERRGSGAYWIAYRWTDGGLFGGHSLRLTGMTRG